jgi:sec-independent protein translocase protein TatA
MINMELICQNINFAAMIGMAEILVIVGVVVLLFGAKRIPELARAAGKASYEFKKAKEGLTNEAEEMIKASEAQAAAEDKSSEAAENSDKQA